MNQKVITCPICASKNVKTLKNLTEYNCCPNCNTAWLKKFPKSTYGDIYYQGKSHLIGKLFEPILSFFYALRANYIHLSAVKLWIDVGAGEGNFLSSLNAKSKLGVEISKSGRELMAKKGIKTLTNEAFLSTKSLNADVISFWHVIEHLEDPSIYIKAASRNIATGGKLVIGIPNVDSREFKFFGKYWFHLAPLYHLWHFSPTSLEILLNKNGFKLQSIDYWAPEHHLVGLLQSVINYTTKTENILHKLVKRQDKDESFPIKSYLIAVFWLTIGLPVVLGWWIFDSITKKSGAIVAIAQTFNKN